MLLFATGFRDLIVKFLVAGLVSAFIIYRNSKENNRRIFRWKNIFLLLGLTYLWLYATLLIHELGHAIPGYLTGSQIPKISLGVGPTLVKFSQVGNLKFNLVWKLLPLGGYTLFWREKIKSVQIFTLASGVIFEFLFSWSVYFWLKNRAKQRGGEDEKSLSQLWMIDYLIPAIFGVSFICNCIPFVIPTSDYTKITKLLLGIKFQG
ncbi:MAG: site-2 protease family protein [Candidatus Moeniiplasma glomeromycotorum]|nr:site-2 protease family protein [Candidatus Moeniiplasma glomeromycotorum]MCE8162432.1 site-2 protease family protein [Candidatus Moeniiplasma glomeromycotorum]MCE8166358.1 site-2 protease family protein [Candidatus Moeniiplasma glomeromycotorum]MCE8166840.1 site-2 protease family protein [Candidatus Moeniiplasma glomeromycotorum]